MMKIKTFSYMMLSFGIGLYRAPALADTTLNATGEIKALYGYTDVAQKYKNDLKQNNLPTEGWISFSLNNQLSEQYELGIFADFMAGTDKYLKNYNQGDWGQEIYARWQTPFGQFALGQMYNVAYEQGISAPSFGALTVNNSNVVDFIHNPNWLKRKKDTAFRTLNSTYINTDGDSVKFSYFTPELYNTVFAVSYIPYTYNRSSLINKYAPYHNEGGAVFSALNTLNFDTFEIQTSAGYANFFENTQEYTLGMNIYRKGFTLGASWRRTNPNGNKNQPKRHTVPEFFVTFRNAEAYNIGLGYEFGPLKIALSYFNSKAKEYRFEDNIWQLSGEFRVHKHINIYSAVAYTKFSGEKDIIESNNKGYAFIIGTGINF